MSRLSKVLSICCLASLPAIAGAGGTATLQAHSEEQQRSATVSIEFDGANAARLTQQDPSKGYLLVRDAKAYTVVTEDGTTKVYDMAQVASLLKGMPRMAGKRGGGMGGKGPQIAADIAEFKSLTDTGRAETVAGIGGSIYQLSYLTDEGAEKTVEAVLSRDPLAFEFSNAMMHLGQTMRETMGRPAMAGSQQLWAKLETGKLGLLRLGDQMRLTRLEGAAPAASRFELPAAPTPVDSIRDLQALRTLKSP